MMNRKIAAVYVSIIMFTMIFVVFSEHSIASPPGWSEDTRLTNDGSYSFSPAVLKYDKVDTYEII